MSKLTEKYGKFVSLYEGEGKLNQQECKFEQECKFKIGQQSDGTIIVECEFSDFPETVDPYSVELCGHTDKGLKVFGKGPHWNRTWGAGPDTVHEAITYFSHYRFWTLNVGEADWSRAHSIKFAITNFLFYGNDKQASGRSNCLNVLKLKLDDLNISFQKVASYDNVLNSVGRGEKTEVTCELVIEVASRSQKEILEFARNICDLLTIAKGRKINWINYKVYDANSSIIFTSHQSRLTDPNNGYELINFREAQMAVTYLEQCYPAYKQFDLCHPTMLNGVANMMSDSNATRFPLSRALVMFSAVDALSNKVSSNSYFKARIRCLKTMYNVCLDEEEIEFFRKSRNSVVHELKFHTNDTIEEYKRCYHIFHRLLLRILDYQSDYFDITQYDPKSRTNKLQVCP